MNTTKQQETTQTPVKGDFVLYEKHKTVHARSVSGRFNNWRWGLVFITQAIFYGLCWVDWNGRQAVLFHLVERKFYVFGLVLWPQDVIYLAILLVVSAYGLFFVTAIGGRLFCGYACPQTVYTEIMTWIESKVEGPRPARIKLEAGPRNGRWWRLKIVKHALWALVALWTGVTFVGYFSPMRELMEHMAAFTFGPWESFWILFYAAFLYMQAGFLREQVCKYMCPYARFQGVMFDPDTLIISYDAARGEPRGARNKKVDYKAVQLGECIDCALCVHACPTGIDIRNGLQLECIACAACIDVCDEVMDKMNYPRGLVRYSTENALAKNYSKREMLAHLWRPRTLLYGAVLFLIIAAASWSLAARVPLKVDVIRDRSNLGREVDDNLFENVYLLHVMNTDDVERHFRISAYGLEGLRIAGADEIVVPSGAMKAMDVALRVKGREEHAHSAKVFFNVKAMDANIEVHEKTTFLFPDR
ncbi:MAG: cytochrome c oxidase accessory protein CcoG [Betaproteobacteria bacterium]|nr:cytochrome c oxidase accessory protein CcoG [Betaproteobacteria bacterium]